VTTPGGTATTTFTVTGQLLSVAPTAAVRGTTVPLTLSGVDLSGATAVTVSGAGVTCSVTGSSSTTINASCAITATAATGARNVTATTAIGATNTLVGVFTVQGPTLTSISPTSGTHGTTVPITLNGTNLTGATAVTMSGSGVTCTGVTSTATTVNASCAVTAGAALTARNVTVVTPITTGTTLTAAFTVK